jgi:Cys-tRNA(Pro) deacylase
MRAWEKVLAFFADKGQSVELYHFNQTTHNCEAAAAALNVALGQILKSLLFVCNNSFYLVVAPGDKRVDTKKVKKYLGVSGNMQMASPETVLKITGFPAGGVPPVAHKEKLRILIDENILKYNHVFAGAGTLHTMLKVEPEILLAVTNGEVINAVR